MAPPLRVYGQKLSFLDWIGIITFALTTLNRSRFSGLFVYHQSLSKLERWRYSRRTPGKWKSKPLPQQDCESIGCIVYNAVMVGLSAWFVTISVCSGLCHTLLVFLEPPGRSSLLVVWSLLMSISFENHILALSAFV
jgi:hypothetical protein